MHQFQIKNKIKCITEYDGFGDLGGNYLNKDVLEIPMYDFVDRDGPLDDNFIEPIHESWLHMQDANKTKALSCVDCEVTIFTCRNSIYHCIFAMFYKLDALTSSFNCISIGLIS